MRHDIQMIGNRYALRPVEMDDAAFIVQLRSDQSRNAFVHAISNRVEDQTAWLRAYSERPGDWYFIVADMLSKQNEGTIGLYDYDADQRTAEWGRWVLRPGSVAAVESALLIYRVAFEILGLAEVYCRTIAGNKKVVSFHDSCGVPQRALLPRHVVLSGRMHDSVEHRLDRATWRRIRPNLDLLAERVAGMDPREDPTETDRKSRI